MFERLKQKSNELKDNYDSYQEQKEEKRRIFLEDNADNLPKIFKATTKSENIHIDEVSNLFKVLNVRYEKAIKKSKSASVALFFATGGISALVPNNTKNNKTGIYRFNDLISYELIIDDHEVTSGGLGRALVGGFLTGGDWRCSWWNYRKTQDQKDY